MQTVDGLHAGVQGTHEQLETRLGEAKRQEHPPGQPRKVLERVDTLLAAASRHLNAVDAVLLPAVRRCAPDGARLVRDYLHTARECEVALGHVKARCYGSVYQAGRPWSAVWADVEETLAAQRAAEVRLVDVLAEHLDGAGLDDLADRLVLAERRAPTRPHPYLPHTGLTGTVSRRVVHAVDAFWDATEGRMLPDPPARVHPAPGRVAQYFLADPRFDEE